MHTGVISFCDRISFNIKSSDIKDKILKDLNTKFEIVILQKHWHKLDENNIKYIQRIPHIACLRSNGNPYYMYFTKYEGVEIIYFIDKKVQSGYQVPRIILCKGMWKPEIFNDTLIEGEMVKNFEGKWLFLINDVIGFKGKYLSDESLPKRIEYAFDMLTHMHTPNKYMDVCEYRVKKYAHATQQGTDALIELSKTLNYTSRGIYYCTFSYKYKPKLVNFDDSLIKSVIRKVKDVPDFKEALPPLSVENLNTSIATSTSTSTSPQSQSRPQLPKMKKRNSMESIGSSSNSNSIDTPREKEIEKYENNCEKVLWLRKTENPDVYDVYNTDHGMVNNSKIGIASVHTLATSKMLRNAFKEATVAMYIPYTCRYEEDGGKWVPISKFTG